MKTNPALGAKAETLAIPELMLGDRRVLVFLPPGVKLRVFERARGVLSEDQLGAFGKFQTNHLQMMRMGMNMAKKFMSSEQPTPESPALPRP